MLTWGIPARAKSLDEQLRDLGLDFETHRRAIVICQDNVSRRFVRPYDASFLNHPGTARLPDSTLRLYGSVGDTKWLFGWRCVLGSDNVTVKTIKLMPFCKQPLRYRADPWPMREPQSARFSGITATT
jgi:hypothetical protein